MFQDFGEEESELSGAGRGYSTGDNSEDSLESEKVWSQPVPAVRSRSSPGCGSPTEKSPEQSLPKEKPAWRFQTLEKIKASLEPRRDTNSKLEEKKTANSENEVDAPNNKLRGRREQQASDVSLSPGANETSVPRKDKETLKLSPDIKTTNEPKSYVKETLAQESNNCINRTDTKPIEPGSVQEKSVSEEEEKVSWCTPFIEETSEISQQDSLDEVKEQIETKRFIKNKWISLIKLKS